MTENVSALTTETLVNELNRRAVEKEDNMAEGTNSEPMPKVVIASPEVDQTGQTPWVPHDTFPNGTWESLIGAVLSEHFPIELRCDHERKLDQVVCSCARTNLGWHPSVGAATRSWVAHVTRKILDV